MNGPSFIEKRNAYHEAGHAVASYLAGIPFVYISIDSDPDLNNNPGILWDNDVIQGPRLRDGRSAWYHHQQHVLTIDFSGRASERFVSEQEISFPSLASDGVNLALDANEVAIDDFRGAWKRFIAMEGHFDFPDLLRDFEEEYRKTCAWLSQHTHRRMVEELARMLLSRRRIEYEEAILVIKSA